MRGDIATALALLQEQYDGGADPGAGAARARRIRPSRHAAEARAGRRRAPRRSTEEERRRGAAAAQTLSVSGADPRLADSDEGRRRAARLAAAARQRRHGAGAPDLCRRPAVAGGGAAQLGFGQPRRRRRAARSRRRRSGQPPRSRRPRAALPARRGAQPSPRRGREAARAGRRNIADFATLVALAGEKRDIQLKIALERDVRLVRFEQGRIEFALAPGGSTRLPQQLMQQLQDWTGTRWMVALAPSGGRADA